jgi:hypothetical protein
MIELSSPPAADLFEHVATRLRLRCAPPARVTTISVSPGPLPQATTLADGTANCRRGLKRAPLCADPALDPQSPLIQFP